MAWIQRIRKIIAKEKWEANTLSSVYILINIVKCLDTTYQEHFGKIAVSRKP
jgi:hypothetical protein